MVWVPSLQAASPETSANNTSLREEPAMLSTAGGGEKAVKRQYDLVNPASLDCPNCWEPLSPPVFQCRNGRIACTNCCTKDSQGCPECSEPVDIPCLAMDRVLESLQVSCKHASKGCKERLKHFEIEGHETQLCNYADVYRCPVSDCGHETLREKMLNHIINFHSGRRLVARNLSSTPSVKLSRSMDKRWKSLLIITSTSNKDPYTFVVHLEERKSLGVLFFCTSIGDSMVFYNLKVKILGGSASYALETTAPFLQRKGESPCNRQFLLIPTGIDCDEACCEFQVELSFPGNKYFY